METRLAQHATTVNSIREMLQSHPREGRLKRLSPDRRALYERMIKRRDESGRINFDIVEALRELRGDG